MLIHQTVVGQAHTVIHGTQAEVKDTTLVTKQFAAENIPQIHYVDLTIHFIGASGLPKMDLIGTADPYFIAKLDGKLSYMYVA